MLELVIVPRTNIDLLRVMDTHYSQPKGFVGRNICYKILYNNKCYGFIVGGSATKFLPGRNEFFKLGKNLKLTTIINNIFFHIEGPYPIRNFSQKVIAIWRLAITTHWKMKYGDSIIGFETLVEIPRTGECYKRDNWILVGQTKGYTCKREGGQGTDSWTGKRVWNTDDLRPKWVFCRRV